MITKLNIKEGKYLTDQELEIINIWIKKEFNSKSIIHPIKGDDNWNKKYFLLKNKNNKIVAFARLHEVNIEFLGVNYSILGLATFISTERGKGFGKKLTLEMKKYVQKLNKTSIGFCNKKLTDFYSKCGFGIIPDGTLRFLYKDGEDKLIKDPWGGGDVFYIESKDCLIKEIINQPDDKVISYRQHW